MFKSIKNWFRTCFKSQEEIYLSEAADIMDLENRLRNLEYNRYMNRMGKYDTRYFF